MQGTIPTPCVAEDSDESMRIAAKPRQHKTKFSFAPERSYSAFLISAIAQLCKTLNGHVAVNSSRIVMPRIQRQTCPEAMSYALQCCTDLCPLECCWNSEKKKYLNGGSETPGEPATGVQNLQASFFQPHPVTTPSLSMLLLWLYASGFFPRLSPLWFTLKEPWLQTGLHIIYSLLWIALIT